MISGNSIAFKAVTARNPFEMDQLLDEEDLPGLRVSRRALSNPGRKGCRVDSDKSWIQPHPPWMPVSSEKVSMWRLSAGTRPMVSMRSGRRLEISALEQEILAKMHSAVKIRPAITWLNPFTLERATKKTQIPGKAS
jgi:hypothetical protein